MVSYVWAHNRLDNLANFQKPEELAEILNRCLAQFKAGNDDRANAQWKLDFGGWVSVSVTRSKRRTNERR